MILNLGNDVPAGSTLAINFTYVASLCDFASGGAPGLCRWEPAAALLAWGCSAVHAPLVKKRAI